MTDNVSVLPGVERRDIGEACPSEKVLTAAIENGVTDVIVLGRGRDGQFYIAADCPNADTVVGALMRGVWFLTEHEVEQS